MSVSPLASMTGFARQSGGDGKISWTWEIKSVNGKSLEARIRLPQDFEGLEGPARQAIQAKVGRGNLQISLNFDRGENRAAIRVNEALLDEYLRLAHRLEKHGAQPASADGLLGLRGVLELGEEERNEAEEKAREAALLADLALAIEQLVLARRQEGVRLGDILLSILGEIGRLVGAAEGAAATQPEALRQRLKAAIDELLEARPALAEDRLAQELALLVLKADVREELDRLGAHIKQLEALLKDGGAVGRKLDFLCQELNREANTLCSKSVDLELTRIGLDLKGAIDRLREQALNLE